MRRDDHDFRDVPDTAGYIDFPDEVLSTNIFTALLEDDKVPESLKQWREEYDYHLVRIPFNLEHVESFKGVREFQAKIEVADTSDGDEARIDDIGPKTEWKDRAVKGSVELGFDAGEALGGLKVVPFADAVDASASFSYEWKPKVAAVTSGFDGEEATWRLQKAEGQSLDGGHELLLIVRRPRSVKQLKLVLKEAKARYDVGWWMRGVETISDEEMEIDIKFKESSPE